MGHGSIKQLNMQLTWCYHMPSGVIIAIHHGDEIVVQYII